MSDNNDYFYDFYFLDNEVKKNIKKSLMEKDKESIVNDYMNSYEHQNKLYTKLIEFKDSIPRDYLNYLGIEHDWENQNQIQWIDMFIDVMREASYIANVDKYSLWDIKSEDPELYEKILIYRQKRNNKTTCFYYPPSPGTE